MQTCSSCHALSPDTATHCVSCNALLSENSTTAVALTRFQANPRVRDVRLIIAHDCCPACAAAEGTYEKDQAPALPVEGCSNPQGCRCFYEPMLTELYP